MPIAACLESATTKTTGNNMLELSLRSLTKFARLSISTSRRKRQNLWQRREGYEVWAQPGSGLVWTSPVA